MNCPEVLYEINGPMLWTRRHLGGHYGMFGQRLGSVQHEREVAYAEIARGTARR